MPESNYYDTWPESLKMFLKDDENIAFIDNFFTAKLQDIEVKNDKIPESEEIGSLCRNYAYKSFDVGLLIGYAFLHYLDEPLKKFKEEAERISRYELNRLKEITEEWNRDGKI